MYFFKRIFFLVLCSVNVCTYAQIPAFPGAEGGGKFTTGGRGGKVLFVDNLNDKGSGSFRDAVEAVGPRTIVFRVSGNIELQKNIHIKNGNLTIAGQTAPGDGICLKNYGIRIDADNVIIRYIRIRPGDEMNAENDAIYGLQQKNIIIDHCSFSWANDEVASFYDNENFTLQWCIISESLYLSDHHKGAHGYGGIWGGLNASFHHNLISDHSSRNPRFCGSRYSDNPELEKVDFRNNVIYNWGNNSIYGGEEGSYNIVNNYFKPGVATKKSAHNRILDLTQMFYSPYVNEDTLWAGNFFIHGNVVEGNPETSENNWDYGVHGKGVSDAAKKKSQLPAMLNLAPVNTSSAEIAYAEVLQSAGASLCRDEVDWRIISEVETGHEKFGASFGGGGKGIIDSQNDVGGWPNLKSKTAPIDSDNDGMPDEWEKQRGLKVNEADNNQHSINEHYTNLEVYLNYLVVIKINQVLSKE